MCVLCDGLSGNWDTGTDERCKVSIACVCADEICLSTWDNVRSAWLVIQMMNSIGINLKLLLKLFFPLFSGSMAAINPTCLPAYTATCTNGPHGSVDRKPRPLAWWGQGARRPLHGDQTVVRKLAYSCCNLESWAPQVHTLSDISYIDRC